MKILHIIAAYKPAYIYGGPTMSASMLSEQLIAAGVTADVFTTTANGREELPYQPGTSINIDGVKTTYFKRITKDHSHLSPALLSAVYKNAPHYQVIHIHAWWNLVSVLSCGIALIKKVPVMISPRGTLSSYTFNAEGQRLKKLFHQLIGKRLLNRCHFHVTSAQEYQSIAMLLHPRSITLILNFVKLPAASAAVLPAEGPFRLLFLSRIDPKKGLELLIKALPLLNFTYHLTIGGSGNDNYITYLKQLAKTNEADAHITWAGFQGGDKFRLLAGHQLLVLPSYDENFGNIVIESLSEGTAVLVSHQVGLADYVTANGFGWQCELSPESVAEQLNRIHQLQTELDTIRIQAPLKIRQDFSTSDLVQQYVGMYQKVLLK